MIKEIVLATDNKYKIKEIKTILEPLGIKMMERKDFQGMPLLSEKGNTLEENAVQKAMTVARYTRKLVLSDDSGLIVDAIGGKPGVYSARFAGKNCTFADNNAKLLNMMKKIAEDKRTAKFSCVMVLTDGKELVEVVEGSCLGNIAFESKGRHGFGYDPVFIPKGYKKTFAEMSNSEKNRISHRGKALKKLAKLLKKLTKTDN